MYQCLLLTPALPTKNKYTKSQDDIQQVSSCLLYLLQEMDARVKSSWRFARSNFSNPFVHGTPSVSPPNDCYLGIEAAKLNFSQDREKKKERKKRDPAELPDGTLQ
ncbi:hypothetical protein PDE_03111 [Penicillium oxalicum 114-2]|uniref:Uncharacterized protein n=1 Tax=Penicillium oxalicum (strain 114-2 / CGMCC 5302) TaxID=933388 RepID=S7ZC15_PENO1|nr:hypothetical protein PDE_03111 [Penicillium oxalicum 114-2]